MQLGSVFGEEGKGRAVGRLTHNGKILLQKHYLQFPVLKKHSTAREKKAYFCCMSSSEFAKVFTSLSCLLSISIDFFFIIL